jgi:hypothetical protein
VLPGPEMVSLPLQPKTTATFIPNHFPQKILPCIHNNLNDNCVSKTAFLEEMITIEDTFLHVYHHVFYLFELVFLEFCSTATFEPF